MHVSKYLMWLFLVWNLIRADHSILSEDSAEFCLEVCGRLKVGADPNVLPPKIEARGPAVPCAAALCPQPSRAARAIDFPEYRVKCVLDRMPKTKSTNGLGEHTMTQEVGYWSWKGLCKLGIAERPFLARGVHYYNGRSCDQKIKYWLG